MAQVTATYKGDPKTLATQLNTVAAANTLQIIQKTISAGSFTVTYDNAGPSVPVQVVEVLVGDPDALTARLNALVALGKVIQVTSNTFSASHYLVVYK